MGHAGTSLPGKVALTIDPRILAKLSPAFHIIAVTGTNGKTTTTRMISKILNENGLEHITNKSGANLITGITSTFVEGVNIKGESPFLYALLEVDEATIDEFTGSAHPDVLVVTNFFRDQLDRYGEVYAVVDKVLSGINQLPGVKLVLNADDSLCASLGVRTANKAVYFGIESGASPPLAEKNISTTSYCFFCHTKYDYSYKVLGHLGGFHCPNCGFARPKVQIKCTQIEAVQAASSTIRLEIGKKIRFFKISLPGIYNVYNALAAAACCYLLNLPLSNTTRALGNMKSCFGRMELIPVENGKRILLMLAKNPVGFNQILNYLTSIDQTINAAFIINDKVQDGTDVSWLWDVDFERMCNVDSRIGRIYASGIRAEDMALRLKYAGLSLEKICILKDHYQLIAEGLSLIHSGGIFYVTATYTAMMEIRDSLKKSYTLKEIWQ